MASRIFSRVSRRIITSGRPIGVSSSFNEPIHRLTPPAGLHSLGKMEGTPHMMNRPLQQPFAANATLQRFGICTSTPRQSALGTNQLPAGLVAKKRTSFSIPEIEKIPPYPILFRWIDEIILDYVHHEVTRSMVLLYLRLYLIVFMKDVFLAGYDLLGF